MRHRLFNIQRQAQRCAKVIREANIDLQILESEIFMIEDSYEEPQLMTGPNLYDHRQLCKIVHLVTNMRDWHELVMNNSIRERDHLLYMKHEMSLARYPLAND